MPEPPGEVLEARVQTLFASTLSSVAGRRTHLMGTKSSNPNLPINGEGSASTTVMERYRKTCQLRSQVNRSSLDKLRA